VLPCPNGSRTPFTTEACLAHGMGSFVLGRFEFDPTPQTAGGGFMILLSCFRVRRCMTGALREAQSSRHLAQRGLLAKGHRGWSLCHRSSRGGWCRVLALRVRRNRLGSELASCCGWTAKLLGIVGIVGCWL
jgi:hypothetical protein